MLTRRLFAVIAACMAGEVMGAFVGLVLAMNVFAGPSLLALLIILVFSQLGLVLTLAVITGDISVRNAPDDDPPLGIGA